MKYHLWAKHLVIVMACVAAAWLGAISSQADSPESKSAIDVDQLAGRMKRNVDVYQKVRDQSLAVYAKLHPSPSAYDDDARQAIRLAAYLWVWDDFYREGLWEIAVADATRATNGGSDDPLMMALPVIHFFDANNSTSDHQALFLNSIADRLNASAYPDELKFWCYRIDSKNLVKAKSEHEALDPKTVAMIPGIVDKAANAYGELIKAHLDRDLLFAQGHTFFHGLQPDEDSIKAAGAAVDKALGQVDPTGALRLAMRGAYYTTYAWTARGIGNADTITDDGLRLFNDRLQTADGILEPAYASHPNVGIIAQEMLTVELGQGQGRNREELWFGRAIKANPDDLVSYQAKGNYLKPKWYGSDDDLWNFGVEAAKTQNWSAKIPMVLVDLMVSDLWKKHPEYLTDPDKWQVLESTFRGYLNQFPRSNYYRSIFARWATEGQHWVVAEEQFKILGDDWDRVVFPGSRYPEMRGLADQNTTVAK
jgi:hypothetical protein